MVGVILCSKARFFSAASTLSISAISRSAARVSCTLRQVSSTSEEVMPWCTKRASGPTISARWVRKAMTSCLVSRSISSIRADIEGGVLGLGPDRLGGFLGDHAEFRQRVRRMRLDLEPDLEAGLRLPDGSHFRAGIAGDHRRLRRIVLLRRALAERPGETNNGDKQGGSSMRGGQREPGGAARLLRGQRSPPITKH